MTLGSAATPISVAVVSALAAGCAVTADPSPSSEAVTGSATPSQRASEGRAAPDVDAAVVRGTQQYDFPATDSVLEAATGMPTVLQGEVVGWSDGRTMIESDTAGYEAFSYTAVLKIRITRAFSDDPAAHAEYAYVEIERGAGLKINGEDPTGSEPVVTSIEALNQAVPQESSVILLAGPADSPRALDEFTPGTTVKNQGRGVPEGSSLLAPSVQGLLFRNNDGAFVSGCADGVESWGWFPDNVPDNARFDYLGDQLEQGLE